jgi:dTDP-4-amino-4,6-dideoxygalactose transaminase
MDNLRAAILRPQLARIDDAIARWNARHDAVAAVLATCPAIRLPRPLPGAARVGSSIQFQVPGITPEAAERFLAATAALGVELKWFGGREPAGFTSAHPSWRYVARQHLPRTDAILAGLFDMRLPLTFSIANCTHIGDIIATCAPAPTLQAAL